MPANLTLSVGKGEDATFTCTHRQSAGGTARNITGWTIAMTILLPGGPLTIPGALTDPTNGVYTLSLTHAQTNVTAQGLACSIFRTDAGSETEMGSGTFTIRPNARYGG